MQGSVSPMAGGLSKPFEVYYCISVGDVPVTELLRRVEAVLGFCRGIIWGTSVKKCAAAM